MKKYAFPVIAVLLLCFCDIEPENPGNETGGIYGSVTDKVTSEPVSGANVILLPSGHSRLTGSDGQYSFMDVETGRYILKVTKTGYTDLIDDYEISVTANRSTPRDVQIEKLPPTFRLVDGNGAAISEIHFGVMNDVRSFGIFNDNPVALEWEIEYNCEWISSVSQSGGTLSTGNTETISVTIDRGALQSVADTAIVVVRSTNGVGHRELKIIANGPHYTLTVSAGTGGTVNPPGATIYSPGSQVTVTAAPSPGYTFVNWTGAPDGVSDTSAHITFSLNGDVALTANFRQNEVVIPPDSSGNRPFSIEETPEGHVLRGATLSERLNWLTKTAESHNTYILEVSAGEIIAPYQLVYAGALNITVILRGSGANRTVSLNASTVMFSVGSNVTLVLDSNITLEGRKTGNVNPVINLNGGTLKMNNGSAIAGNKRNGGNGGAVYVSSSGTVVINGGTISGNTAANGGGVYVYSGTVTMNGGSIEGNTSTDGSGGGVYLRSGTFTMIGGTISGNKAGQYGGGVYVDDETFNMRGGEITGNTAASAGGGVYVDWANFTKTGGVITGYGSDPDNGNVVRDHDDLIARSGHAVYAYYYNGSRRKETTAGPGNNLSFSGYAYDGAWDE